LKADAVKKLSEEITMGEEDIFISEKLGNKFFLFYIHPLVRRGNLIGTTWAIMEFRDFYEPFMVNIRIAFIVMIAGILAALAAGNRLRKGFEYIQDGLQKLKVDLGYRFEKRGGEIGEISNAINELASTLSKVRSYTELILEGTGEGVIALDKDSKVVFFNKSAEILLNINRENVIEKDYREIVTEEKDLLRETIEDALAGKNRNILKSVYRLNNGREIPLSINSFCLDTRGREGAVMILRDLSDMERLERKLRQTDKLAALGKLVAGVAHEIRNPIASIRANVQLWKKRLEKTPPSEEALDMVIDEIDRLNGIVEKWLIFAKYRTSLRENYQINEVIKKSSRTYEGGN
jgi:two-component system sensor histidine kinase AtoS